MRKIDVMFFGVLLAGLFGSVSFAQLSGDRKQYAGQGAISEFTMPAQASIVGHFSLFYEAVIPADMNADLPSFWYKIVFNKDCYLKFNLFPIVESDRYDFKLVKVEQNANFCEALVTHKVEPMNHVRIKKIWKDSAQSAKFRSNLVYTTEIPVKKGDAIYMEVVHLWGKDLGHIIDLKTCDYSYVLKARREQPVSVQVDSSKMMNKIQSIENDDKETASRIAKTLCPPNGRPVKLSSICFGDKKVEVKNHLSINGNEMKTPDKLVAAINTQTQAKPTEAAAVPNEIKPIKKVVINAIDTVLIKIKIEDAVTGKPIPAKPELVEETTGKPIPARSIKEGLLEIRVQKGTKLLLQCHQTAYKKIEKTIIADASMDLDIKMQPYQQGENFILRNILFHPNTPVVKHDSYSELEKLAGFLLGNPSVEIEVSGHTNGNRTIRPDINKENMGEDWLFKGSSKKLSKVRAEKVKEYLVQKGIHPSRIKIKGYGGDKSLYEIPHNQDEINKNIRVEVMVLKS